jgi:sortase A
MPSPRILRALEYTLTIVGLTLALWCAVVFVEARHTKNLPVPPPSTAVALPGDAADDAPRPHPPVAAGAWVARLDAPTVHLNATVLEGTSDATLARAAGHIEDTAFPGESGNFGIAGHRDTTFRPVRRIKPGDPLVVTTPDRVYTYRVTRTFIVAPQDVYVLDPADHSTLTLVTCYPFEFIGHAPKRFIVAADLVEQRGAGGSGGAGTARR